MSASAGRCVYCRRMLRTLALSLVASLAWVPAAAEPQRARFAWAGRVELEGAPLLDPSADDEARRAAIAALRGYPVELTGRFLLAALADEDVAVRLEAARAAGVGRLSAAVPTLIAWLADPDRTTRRVASFALGKIADSAAAAALVRTLGDPDGEVRLGAVEALGGVAAGGDRTIVVPLISRVADDKSEVRKAAIEALRAVGDRRAVVAVVGAFSDSNLEVRKAAVIAAGKLGDPAAIPALLRLLDGGPPELRTLAIAALGDLGAAEATDELIALVRRGGDVAAPAAFALGQIAAGASGPAAERAVRALVEALASTGTRTPASEALRRAGATAVPALVAHLDGLTIGDPATAVRLLGEVGDARATEALVAELARRRLALAPVITALARTGDPRALVPLLALLEHDDDEVRHAAMVAVGPLVAEDDRAVDLLVERLGDPREDIQILACRYLARLGAAAAAGPIAALAEAPRAPALRQAAIEALGALATPSATPVLLATLADPDPLLVRAAADALAFAGDAGTADKLAAMARQRGRNRALLVRAWGAALRDRPDASARATLIDLATTGDDDTALAAIGALAAMGDRAAQPALAKLLRDGAPERQRAAAWALGQLADGAAAPAVETALVGALASRDDRIVGEAAWALGRTAGAEGHDALRKLARDGGWAAQINATAALARRGGDAAVPDLLTLLGHADPAVRGNAVWALTVRGDRAGPTVAALARVLADDPEPRVRGLAARALTTVDAPAAKAALIAARDDRDPAVRAIADGTAPPPVGGDEWRIFDVVLATRAPARAEPYLVVLGADGPTWATFSDRRGVIAAEHVPTDVALPAPRAATR